MNNYVEMIKELQRTLEDRDGQIAQMRAKEKEEEIKKQEKEL